MFAINRLSGFASPCAGLLLLLVLQLPFGALAAESGAQGRLDTLKALQQQYGLTEEEAITRLAAQAEATIIHPGFKDFLGEAYAGAWFDNEQLELVVAITDSALGDWVKVAGVSPAVGFQPIRTRCYCLRSMDLTMAFFR